MGLKIPNIIPPRVYGDDCLTCYAAGRTPKYLIITFHDIVACAPHPDPPNDIPILMHQLGNPCEYEGDITFDGRDWQAFYYLTIFLGGEDVSYAGLTNITDGVQACFRGKGLECSFDILKATTSCPVFDCELGEAHVQFLIPTIIILLCTHYHFITQPGRLYERQDVAMDHQLVRIATKFDKTCCYFYVDDEDLEPL